MYEDIHLIFDFNNTCLNLDHWTLCLRVIIVPILLLLYFNLLCYVLSCWCQWYDWLLAEIFFSDLLHSIKAERQADSGS
jgi:hypothetical protein